MTLSDLTIGISPITGSIYLGKISTDGTHWVGDKKDITEFFDALMVERIKFVKINKTNPQRRKERG